MKLSLHKSARFQRFLNTPHSAPVRILAGLIAAATTRIATGEPLLAAEIYRRLAHQNDFRLGLRLMSWYLCRRWPRLQLSNYHFFVFTHALDAPELAALRRFLDHRAGRSDYALWLCDCASTSASLALLQPTVFPRFAADVDALLDAFMRPDTLPTTPATGQGGTFSTPAAEQALRDFTQSFPIATTPWFVISGTFLGLIREGRILAHDHDIDLGLIAGDVDLPAFMAALRIDTRFNVIAEETQTTIHTDAAGQWHTRALPVMVKIAHTNDTSIDIFIHYREGDVIWHGSTLYRWDNANFDLQPYAFCGTTVLGPVDSDRYLTENYGNWRVPVTDFHFSVDTTNLRVVRNPLSIAVFLRRAMMAGPTGRAALLRLLRTDGYLLGDGSIDRPYRFAPTAFQQQPPADSADSATK
jgi:hypothetical protein